MRNGKAGPEENLICQLCDGLGSCGGDTALKPDTKILESARVHWQRHAVAVGHNMLGAVLVCTAGCQGHPTLAESEADLRATLTLALQMSSVGLPEATGKMFSFSPWQTQDLATSRLDFLAEKPKRAVRQAAVRVRTPNHGMHDPTMSGNLPGLLEGLPEPIRSETCAEAHPGPD